MRTWPLVGRDEEVEAIAKVMGGVVRRAPKATDGTGGVVVVGGAGVGKTRLARTVLGDAAGRGATTRWVVATSSAASVPLGAFAPLLPAPVAAPPSPLALLRQASAAVAEHVDGASAVLGVDDAHLLDAMSATLVHQLAVDRVVPLVVTVRSGQDAPDPVVALWKDGHLARIDLEPLSRPQVEDLLVDVLGGPVEGLTLARFWNLSRGNPLYLRELQRGALDDGALRRHDGVWVWDGPVRPNPSLSELVRARIAADGDERTVLELLALAEPLDVRLLDRLTGREAVAAAEDKQLVAVEPAAGAEGADRLVARLAHPLYGEVVRSEMTRLGGDELRARLATALRIEPVRSPADVLRLATLCVDSGVATDPTLLTAGAAQASAAFDHRLAERLATAAVAAGGGFPAAFVLADALMYHRGRETDSAAALEDLEAAASTDHEREVAAIHRAGLLFWDFGAVEHAAQVLRDAEQRCASATTRLVLRATRAYVALVAGQADAAIALTTPLLTSTEVSDRQVPWPAAAHTLACALRGRTTDALAGCQRGWAAQRRLADGEVADPYPPLMIPARMILGLAEGLALRQGGHFTQATTRATELHDQAVDEANPMLAAVACILHGHAAVAAGQPGQARRWLQESLPLLADLDPVGCLYHAHLTLAAAWALSGDGQQAEAAWTEARACRQPFHAMHGVEEGLVDAWVTWAHGDRRRAAAKAADCAARAAADGQHAMEAAALHLTLRLGQPHGLAARLAELADDLDGELVALWAAQAQALQAGDGTSLRETADRLVALGYRLLGAEVHIQAGTAWAAAGRRASALGAAARARELLARCEGARTPITVQLDAPPTLSPREHEVATLAAGGLSNREIAERTYVSVRTAESHLANVFTKLGINRRSQLAEALGLDQRQR